MGQGDLENRSHFRKTTRPIGRTLRFVTGMLLIASMSPFYLQGNSAFMLASLGMAAALVIFYMLVHVLVSRYWPRLNRWLGACLVLAPMTAVYFFGFGGGYIFGAGEGQLGVLTFLGVSLLLAGVRGDSGCEVMTIPGLVFKQHTPLACIVFSPIDWWEQWAFNK